MRQMRPWLVSFVLISGCQVIPASSDTGGTTDDAGSTADDTDLIQCVDPLDLVDDTDYACGDEVIVVVVAAAEGDEFFLDTFTIEAQDETTNRFLLINELDVDICGDITVTIGGTPQAFEVGCLLAGELFPVNSECAEAFSWGDSVDGLCLFEPLP